MLPLLPSTSDKVSVALVAYAVPPFDPAGAKNVGNGAGGQFIGGQVSNLYFFAPYPELHILVIGSLRPAPSSLPFK
jgi:hypothetical protein